MIDSTYKGYVFLILAIVAAFTLALHDAFLLSFPLKSDVFEIGVAANLIAPAFIASLFIERAVEVVVQTWRRFGREEIEKIQAGFRAKLANSSLTAEEQKRTSDELSSSETQLTKYRQATMHMAAGVGLFFSFLAALIGVRILAPFFDFDPVLLACMTGLETDPENCVSGIENAMQQFRYLTGFDIFLTTFVIAGGSAGVHSVVSAITSYADQTKARSREVKGSIE